MERPGKINVRILAAMGAAVLVIAAAALLMGRRLGGERLTDSYPIRISELMTRNESYLNADGLLCDWIELRNVSDGSFDLSGYSLTDVPGQAKYVFPAGTVLGAGEYLVVYCSPDQDDAAYAPFGLSRAGGETVAFENRTHTVLDSVVTLPADTDVSQIRDGEALTLCDYPSPGFENTPQGHEACLAVIVSPGDFCPVALSEIMSSNSLYPAPDDVCRDWIELRNTAATPVNLSGYGLSDREGDMKFVFPSGAVVPAGGCILVWCGGDELADGLWAPFGMSRDGGETVFFLSDNGAVLDSVTLPAMDRDRSFVRGTGGWSVSVLPTPGA